MARKETDNSGMNEKKLEFALGVIGLSLALLAFILTFISHWEVGDKLMEVIIIGPLIAIGSLLTSIIYFGIFLVLFGLNSIGSMKTGDTEFFYKLGVTSILPTAFIISPILVLFDLLLFYYIGVDLYEIITKDMLKYLIAIFILSFLSKLVSTRYQKRTGWDIKGNLIDTLKLFIPGSIILGVCIVFVFIGYISYPALGFPTVDVTTDKPVYYNSDSLALIKTTAFYYATPSRGILFSETDKPLIVIVIPPSGKDGYEKHFFGKDSLGDGAYILPYYFKENETGTYTVKVKCSSFVDTKSFLRINESQPDYK